MDLKIYIIIYKNFGDLLFEPRHEKACNDIYEQQSTDQPVHPRSD